MYTAAESDLLTWFLKARCHTGPGQIDARLRIQSWKFKFAQKVIYELESLRRDARNTRDFREKLADCPSLKVYFLCEVKMTRCWTEWHTNLCLSIHPSVVCRQEITVFLRHLSIIRIIRQYCRVCSCWIRVAGDEAFILVSHVRRYYDVSTVILMMMMMMMMMMFAKRYIVVVFLLIVKLCCRPNLPMSWLKYPGCVHLFIPISLLCTLQRRQFPPGHRVRTRPLLSPGPRWGSLRHSPGPLAGLVEGKGIRREGNWERKGGKGNGSEEDGREGERKERGERERGKGTGETRRSFERNWRPWYTQVVTAIAYDIGSVC